MTKNLDYRDKINGIEEIVNQGWVNSEEWKNVGQPRSRYANFVAWGGGGL
jgi:hypothetical protein